MSFSRANGAGWSTGDTVTHGQINQLDVDHANALDKTGDTIPNTTLLTLNGQLNVGNTGQITFSAGGQIIAGTGSIQANANNAVQANSAGAVKASAANAVESSVAGGISDGGVTAGIKATVAGGIAPGIAGGISDGGIAGGIGASVAKGITDGGVAHGISSTTPGGIAFDGGSSDWPVMSPGAGGRTIQIAVPPIPLGPATGWTAAQGCVIGPATNVPIFLSIPRIFPGCQITQVVPYLKVAGPHSAVPANFPKIEVYKFNWGTAGAPTQLWLNSAHSVSATAGSGAGWDNSGFMQSWLYSCNQNNSSLDAFTTGYYMTLTDENGANSAAGNEYFGFQITIVVTDMRVC